MHKQAFRLMCASMPKLWLNNELLFVAGFGMMFALRMIRPSTLIG